MKLEVVEKYDSIIQQSDLVSRDLSWLRFNERVLDQSRKPLRTVFEKLKFLAITASNLDEFFMIRVGSLYNYLDYDKERVDYSGLREEPFKVKLMNESHTFHNAQHEHFTEVIMPELRELSLLRKNRRRFMIISSRLFIRCLPRWYMTDTAHFRF